MENVKNLSESIICSGSDMNHRTFRDDESWNSLQSTILAGHFSLSRDSDPQEEKNNLTTLNEESLMEELEFKSVDEDENVLNINLDAISDDVFFDCQNISNQKILNESNSPDRNETRSNILEMPSKQQQQQQQFLTVNSPNSANNESTADSGVEDEKTGALLVQIVEDFKDMKDHAQSTPKHLSPTTNVSKNLTTPMNSVSNNNNANNIATSLKIMTNVNSETKNCSDRKTLNCLTSKVAKRLQSPSHKQYSPVDRTNTENFFAGKYSSAVDVVCKTDINVASPGNKKPCKVAEMKQFFENQSRLYEQSRSRQIDSKIPMRKVGLKQIFLTKSPQVRSTRSPSYHTQETFKLLKSSKALKVNGKSAVTFNNNGNSSFFLRNQGHYANRGRPSSCSDFMTDSSTNYNISKNTSKSTGDMSKNCIKHTKLLYATERKMINKRPNYLVNQCMTLNPKSPKNLLKVSDIMKRKSLGYVSSPVKPVKELRKIFSPGRELNAQVKKRSNKKTPAIKIVISNE